jgi:hypothetical protein
MKTIGTLVLILCGLTAATADAQSLAEMARREAQRRAAIEQPAPLLTNTDLVAASRREINLRVGSPAAVGRLFARMGNRAPALASPFGKRAQAVNSPLFGQIATLYQPVRPAAALRALSRPRQPFQFGQRQMTIHRPVPRKVIPVRLIAAPRRAG